MLQRARLRSPGLLHGLLDGLYDELVGIVDLLGKRNKARTAPMPSWCKAAIDEWVQVAGIATGRVFRPINKGGRLAAEG